MIVKGNEKLEDVAVRGVTSNKKEAKITICAVPDKTGVAARIFNEISQSGVNVDIIVQNVSHTRHTDISFTVRPRQGPERGQGDREKNQRGRSDVRH